MQGSEHTIEHYQWVVDGLDQSNNPSDWKQSLSTLAFMTTEPYGKELKEKLFIPYLEKAAKHSNPAIQEIAVRFIISFKTFNLFTSLEQDILVKGLYEKFFKNKKADFLDPLKITFDKLKKEKKLDKFLHQLGQGKFSEDIVHEISFQLYYRDIHKMEQALDIIYFLIKELKVEKQDFIPVLQEFKKDIDSRIYLKGEPKVRKMLHEKADKIIQL